MDDGYLFWAFFIGPQMLVVGVALLGVAIGFVGVLLWGLNQAISSALDSLVARARGRRKAL